MKQQKPMNLSIGVGTASILMIFILLTLVTFASLSLVSAKADENLTNKSVVYTEQYNQASSKAQEKLAVIDQCISEEGDVDAIEGVTINGDFCQFSESINEGQSLSVSIQLLKAGNRNYKVIEYETVNESEWNADEKLPVYQP